MHLLTIRLSGRKQKLGPNRIILGKPTQTNDNFHFSTNKSFMVRQVSLRSGTSVCSVTEQVNVGSNVLSWMDTSGHKSMIPTCSGSIANLYPCPLLN